MARPRTKMSYYSLRRFIRYYTKKKNLDVSKIKNRKKLYLEILDFFSTKEYISKFPKRLRSCSDYKKIGGESFFFAKYFPFYSEEELRNEIKKANKKKGICIKDYVSYWAYRDTLPQEEKDKWPCDLKEIYGMDDFFQGRYSYSKLKERFHQVAKENNITVIGWESYDQCRNFVSKKERERWLERHTLKSFYKDDYDFNDFFQGRYSYSELKEKFHQVAKENNIFIIGWKSYNQCRNLVSKKERKKWLEERVLRSFYKDEFVYDSFFKIHYSYLELKERFHQVAKENDIFIIGRESYFKCKNLVSKDERKKWLEEHTLISLEDYVYEDFYNKHYTYEEIKKRFHQVAKDNNISIIGWKSYNQCRDLVSNEERKKWYRRTSFIPFYKDDYDFNDFFQSRYSYSELKGKFHQVARENNILVKGWKFYNQCRKLVSKDERKKWLEERVLRVFYKDEYSFEDFFGSYYSYEELKNRFHEVAKINNIIVDRWGSYYKCRELVDDDEKKKWLMRDDLRNYYQDLYVQGDFFNSYFPYEILKKKYYNFLEKDENLKIGWDSYASFRNSFSKKEKNKIPSKRFFEKIYRNDYSFIDFFRNYYSYEELKNKFHEFSKVNTLAIIAWGSYSFFRNFFPSQERIKMPSYSYVEKFYKDEFVYDDFFKKYYTYEELKARFHKIAKKRKVSVLGWDSYYVCRNMIKEGERKKWIDEFNLKRLYKDEYSFEDFFESFEHVVSETSDNSYKYDEESNMFVEEHSDRIESLARSIKKTHFSFSISEIKHEIILCIPDILNQYKPSENDNKKSYVFNVVNRQVRTNLSILASDFKIEDHSAKKKAYSIGSTVSLESPLGDDAGDYHDVLECDSFNTDKEFNLNSLEEVTKKAIHAFYKDDETCENICKMFFFDHFSFEEIENELDIDVEEIEEIIELVRDKIKYLLAA